MDDLRTQVFRKMGADIKPCLDYRGGGDIYSWQLNGKAISNSVLLEKYRDSLKLPPIDSQWEVCAKYLVPFMRERGFEYYIEDQHDSNKGVNYQEFWWHKRLKNDVIASFLELKDDNIAKAACETFMEVEF